MTGPWLKSVHQASLFSLSLCPEHELAAPLSAPVMVNGASSTNGANQGSEPSTSGCSSAAQTPKLEGNTFFGPSFSVQVSLKATGLRRCRLTAAADSVIHEGVNFTFVVPHRSISLISSNSPNSLVVAQEAAAAASSGSAGDTSGGDSPGITPMTPKTPENPSSNRRVLEQRRQLVLQLFHEEGEYDLWTSYCAQANISTPTPMTRAGN